VDISLIVVGAFDPKSLIPSVELSNCTGSSF